jgi:peptide/nickel transport system permease protein
LSPPDLGRSFQKERPVLNVVAEAFVNTVYLMVSAILLTWLMALPMGIYCAVHHNEWGDRIVSGLAFVGAWELVKTGMSEVW